MESEESYWEYEGVEPMYTATSSGYYSSAREEEQKPEVGIASSRSLEALEVVLQKVLKYLGAFADNFDRILSSFEAETNEAGSGSGLSRGLKRIGNGLWNQLEGIRIVPEDRSPLWGFGILVLVLCFLLVGFRTSFRQSNTVEEAEVVIVPAKRVQLPDNRSITYREQGVSAEEARHSILVVHGLLSSRLAGIPGINSSLLEEFGVRLISYDLPGFGESVPDHSRDFNSSAHDMASIADAVGLGEQFWLLAHGGGGPHAWAAIRYIPERLAGVALVAPAGNPYGGNLTSEEAANVWRTWSFRRRLLHFIARRFPSLLRAFIRKTVMSKITRISKSLYATVGRKDQALFEQKEFMTLWEENLQESMKQQSVLPLEEELLLLVNDWGFDLGDLSLKSPPVKGFMNQLRRLFVKEEVELQGFQRPIHLWQGTDDVVVPPAVNDFAKRVLPHVKLHKLEGEGHFSWFYLCDECHGTLLETLFGKPEGPYRLEESLLSHNQEQAIVQHSEKSNSSELTQ